jgi:hypothetical protein
MYLFASSNGNFDTLGWELGGVEVECKKVQYSNNDRLRNDRVRRANKRRKFILAQILNLSYLRKCYVITMHCNKNSICWYLLKFFYQL